MTSALRWPDGILDVQRMKASGWRPTAFREFVLKVHQRCNLACDYCYVYTLADQSWRDRPTVMSPVVWQAAASRIADHVRRHELTNIRVVLHGGEPLLAGRDNLLRLSGDIRKVMPETCAVTIGMQTNGVLLDVAMLEALHGAGISIGVSIDGAAADHDRHRRGINGRGSHAAAVRALALLRDTRFRSSFAGLLCTVDPATDPIESFEALLSHSPPSIDFLLPHANWSVPPRRLPEWGPTPYGDWLVRIFDRWYDSPYQETHIRILEEIINLVLGGSSRSEQVGLSPVAVAVVESDGAIEQVDSLKSAYPGACATGLDVRTHGFDEALDHPGIVARQIGLAALGDTCLSCPIHRICGAGHYAHRYRLSDGFRNPSVYCPDLIRIIGHVRDRVRADVRRLQVGSAA